MSIKKSWSRKKSDPESGRSPLAKVSFRISFGRWESCDTVTPLKTIKRNRRAPLPPLETGQVWELEGSNVHIGLIGKTLVHYKHFKGDTKRAPISLSGKTVLEKYLKEKKAVLLPHVPCVAPRAAA